MNTKHTPGPWSVMNKLPDEATCWRLANEAAAKLAKDRQFTERPDSEVSVAENVRRMEKQRLGE